MQFQLSEFRSSFQRDTFSLSGGAGTPAGRFGAPARTHVLASSLILKLQVLKELPDGCVLRRGWPRLLIMRN